MKCRNSPKWRKNVGHNQKREFHDGEILLIAVKVKNTRLKSTYWEIDRVRVRFDGDGAYLYHDNEFGVPYDSWNWEDVDYFIPLGA